MRLHATLAGEDEVLLLDDRLSLVPGLRWEVFRDNFAGGAGPPATPASVQVRDFFSPHFGMRAEPVPGLTLLANVGRYAREPNLEELFGNRGVVVGNPQLRPEVAFNRDVGFHLELPDLPHVVTRAALEYAYFDNTIDDLIVLVQNSQNIVQPQNVTQAHVTGHELVVRGRLAERLGLVANYTHERARDVGDVPFLHGKQLPGRPADEAYARLELGWSRAHPLPFDRAAPLWPFPSREAHGHNDPTRSCACASSALAGHVARRLRRRPGPHRRGCPHRGVPEPSEHVGRADHHGAPPGLHLRDDRPRLHHGLRRPPDD